MKHTQLKKKFEKKFSRQKKIMDDGIRKMGYVILRSDKEQKELWSFIHSAVEEARKDERKRIIELIEENGPDIVAGIDEPPFREDYVNKWNLIDLLNKQTK